MRHRPARRFPLQAPFAFPLAACLVAALSVGACSNEGEGEICDPNASNAGNDDCQSGLTCQQSPLPGVLGYRCCPTDLTQATVSVCSGNHEVADANAAPPDATLVGPPAEAGDSGDSGDTGAAPEAAPDGSSDGAADVATESSSEGAAPEASAEASVEAADGARE